MKFILNGKDKELNIPEDTPSLWAIREELKDESVKFGCGRGLCGACTILIDGEPTRSCVTPVSDLEGAQVTTTAGLRKPGEAFSNLQRSWIDENVAQCGYCQPGQLMKAHSFLNKNSDPTEQDIRDEMDNLCRCGTYPRMITAIMKTAELNRLDRESSEAEAETDLIEGES